MVVSELKGERIYLDANYFIYLLEPIPIYMQIAKEIGSLMDTQEAQGITSELTLSEVLVGPVGKGQLQIANQYRSVILDSDGISAIPVGIQVLERSVEVRTRTSAKLPDAIHIASAIEAGCTMFLSNDKSIRSCCQQVGMPFVLFSDVQP